MALVAADPGDSGFTCISCVQYAAALQATPFTQNVVFDHSLSCLYGIVEHTRWSKEKMLDQQLTVICRDLR